MRFAANILLFLLGILLSGDTQGKGGALDFIANHHQWPVEARYKAELPGGSVFLVNDGFVYSYYSIEDVTRIHDQSHESNASNDESSTEPVRCHAYRVRLEGSNPASLNHPGKKVPNYYNFFLGNDSGKWAGNVPAYEEVRYENVYKGIDLQVYSSGTSMKYDFVVAAKADASAIHLAFEGVTPKLTADGDLLLQTSVNQVLEKAPYAYQLIHGTKQKVTCRYTIKNNKVGFAFPEGYDHNKPLIIDPVLDFATYSGSTGITFGWSATYDTAGNLYAGGQCFGTGWPVTLGAFKTTYGGQVDAAINKYSSNGSALIYSTYFGGDSADYPNTMVVNRVGELMMAGATHSANLPTTTGAFDNTFNGGVDIYIVHFNAAGSGLLGCTYLGGSNREGDISTSLGKEANRGEIITDTSGNIYIAFATASANFPVTSGAFQTSHNGPLDAFVAKLNSSCSNLLFSTFLGGSGSDAAICMQLSPTGNIIVGGGTTSVNFPGVSGGWQSSYSGSTDGFVAILNGNATSLQYATYVGTGGTDDVSKVHLDVAGNVYATGINTAGTFPVSPFVYADTSARDYIIKLNPTLSTRLLSTTIGGVSALAPTAFMVDVCGNIYFMGYGPSTSTLALTSDAFQTTISSFWMCVLNPNMASIRYASFFGSVGDHIDGGSSRLDPNGIVYHSICTDRSGMPTNSSVWSPNRMTGGFDIASWKFSFQLSGMKAGFDIGFDTVCAPATVAFQNTTVGALSYLWDFGDGSLQSSLHTPLPHQYRNAGTYTIKLYTYNIISCVPIDSAQRTIHVFDRDSVFLEPIQTKLCGKDSARMKVKPQWNLDVVPNTGVTYVPSGGNEIVFHPAVTTNYVVIASNPGPCHVPSADTLQFTIIRDTTTISHINPITDTTFCNRDTAIYRLAHKLTSFTVTPPRDYSLSSDSLTLRFYPSISTQYQFRAVKANACDTIRDTINFMIHRAQVNAAFTLDPKLTDQHDPAFHLTNWSSAAKGYQWFVNNDFWTTEASPTLSPRDTGVYCFTLVSSNEYCMDTAIDCGHLIETHIYMPSAFSPNGDGKNDVFRPIQNNVEVLEFAVFNRYGQRLFVCFDNKGSWDGRFNGNFCDLGTYFWKLNYRVLGRKEYMLKGDVTLVR